MVISQHELKSKRGVYEHIEAIKASLLLDSPQCIRGLICCNTCNNLSFIVSLVLDFPWVLKLLPDTICFTVVTLPHFLFLLIFP